MRQGALVLLLAVSGCWVPVGRGKQMEARIQRLEEENALSQKQLDEQRAVLRDRVAKVDEKIAEVQKKLDELNTAARRSGADLAVSQDKLEQEQAKLRGLLEEEQHRLAELRTLLEALRADSEARFAALKGAGALDELEARRKVAALNLPNDKNAWLEAAQKQEAEGEKLVAHHLYEEFARRWPTDPRAADAHFRLGDLNYASGRQREAILSFGKVVQDFPRSDKAPDALLRTGEAMLSIGLRDDAKAILESVVERYPKSAAAGRAKARLAELFPPPAPPPKSSKGARGAPKSSASRKEIKQ